MSALPAATRLGPYEIVSAIGAGGMGAVYLARDTRLDRTVAIKVLLAHAAADPEFRDRFAREARVISALSHPHICALYDIGNERPQVAGQSSEPIDFLVMEFVDGETLAARLARGPLPLADVLSIGMQIAQALDAAHRRGIVHRDLKPGNVILTKAGVKLLDFGLAKLGGVTVGTSHSEAATAFAPQPLTAKGTILGTLQYMSPEQLEGKDADQRADVFALGAILYEMATGHRAFEGASSASVISAILGKEPAPMASIQPLTPLSLERIVRDCLAKDPDGRLQSAHDVMLALRWITEGGSESGIAAPAAARVGSHAAIVAAAALALSTLALGVVHFSETPPALESLRFTVPANDDTEFMPGQAGGLLGRSHQFALSPDGTRIVFVAREPGEEPRLWVRRFDAIDATPLNATERDIYHDAPRFLPDGRLLYVVNAYGNPARTGIHLMSLGSSQSILVLPDVLSAVAYLPTGELLFDRQGALMRVGFDLNAGRTSGEPMAVTTDTGGGRQLRLSASDTGRVAYATGPAPQSQLFWYDRSGARGQSVGPAAQVRDKVPMMDFTVWHAPYDVGADGRFLINTSLVSPTASPITVISNWKN